MPAISLDFLVREKASSTSINAVKGCVLGIEVDHYLRRLIQLYKSPLFTPWGGISPVLYKMVREDLGVLQQAGIEPFFVFSGLVVPQDYNAPHEAMAYARSQALEALERRRNEETLGAFASLVRPAELSSGLMAFFKQEAVKFLVAPYFANAQLAAMASGEVDGETTAPDLDCVYASADALVFGIERLVLDITFQQGRMLYCERSVILQQGLGGLTDDQFLDAFLFAGNDYCSLVPILVRHNPPEMNSMRIRAAADVVRQNRTGYQAIEGNPLLESEPAYVERWLRARVLYKNHPYLTRRGDVVLLSSKDAPIGAAEVVGPRLPREIYFYLSRGIIACDVLNILLSGKWTETTPLDAGETKEYRALLDALTDYRAQCIDLLTADRSLHIYFQKRSVYPVLYHDQTPFPLEIERFETPLREGLQRWNIDAQFLAKHNVKSTNSIQSLLMALENPNAVKDSLQPAKILGSHAEVEATVMYRLLEVRAYILPDHTLSGWGKALLGALRAADPQLAIPICTSFELLKVRAIKFEAYSKVYPAAATNLDLDEPTGNANPNARNTARLASLLPLSQSDVPWQGVLDRNMLIAFDIAKTMQNVLAQLYDMVQASLLLSGLVQRDDTMLMSLANAQNPFQVTHDAGLATYAKQWFSLASSGPKLSDVKDIMRQRFPNAAKGPSDIDVVLKVWNALFEGVDVATKVGCMGEVERSKFAALKAWQATSLTA